MEQSKSQFTENLGEEADSFSRDCSFQKESTRQPHEMVSAFSRSYIMFHHTFDVSRRKVVCSQNTWSVASFHVPLWVTCTLSLLGLWGDSNWLLLFTVSLKRQSMSGVPGLSVGSEMQCTHLQVCVPWASGLRTVTLLHLSKDMTAFFKLQGFYFLLCVLQLDL